MSKSYDGDSSVIDSIEIRPAGANEHAIYINDVWFGGIHYILGHDDKIMGFTVEGLKEMAMISYGVPWNKYEGHPGVLGHTTEFFLRDDYIVCDKCDKQVKFDGGMFASQQYYHRDDNTEMCK